jgi:hypothetical protein
MAISKITTGSIEDGTIATSDIAAGAVTTAKIDTAYTTSITTNPVFSGTAGTTIPSGTTDQRGTPSAGALRFNTTLALMEYYTGTEWKSIDSPPTITSITPTTFTTAATTITVNGSNFQTGVNVKVLGADLTEYTPDSVTRVSAAQLTFATTAAMISGAKDLFGIRVTNASGLSITYSASLEIATSFTFTNSAGSLGYINDQNRATYTAFSAAGSLSSSEADVSVVYSVLSGSLPTGTSLSSSTGAISGTASAVVSDTTSNFTIRAAVTDASTGATVNNDRAFSITVLAPVTVAFSYTGADQSWTVPTGVSRAIVKAWGAGGGSDSSGSGRYGAYGGFATGTATLTPGQSMVVVVGQGGAIGAYGGSGGGGGGYAGLFRTSVTQGNAILIAGGGGGAGDGSDGGGGGGTTGGTPVSNLAGGGGTQSAGGVAGNTRGSPSISVTLPTAGAALQGGNGGDDAGSGFTRLSYGGGGKGGSEPGGSQAGGGGGGGYFGGGGGSTCNYGSNSGGAPGHAGGGGSGYYNPTYVTSATLTAAPTSSASPASSGGGNTGASQVGNGDANWVSGVGTAGTSQSGGNGRVVIIY